MKILFVENQCVFAATVIRQFLSQHLITVATNLFAARRALADASFDSVLVDYDLDDGSGDELVKESKASDGMVKVVGVSARDEGNTALLRVGSDSVWSKMEFDRIHWHGRRREIAVVGHPRCSRRHAHVLHPSRAPIESWWPAERVRR